MRREKNHSDFALDIPGKSLKLKGGRNYLPYNRFITGGFGRFMAEDYRPPRG